MSVQRLGTYIEQYSQKNKNDEPYPVYSVTNSEGFCTEYFNKDVSGKNKTNYKIVPKGYFAYNPSRINVGSIDWQNSEENVIVSPIYVVFKCLNGLNQDYLKYFIKSSEGIRMINSKVSGAVRNNLRFEDLSEFEFNIVEFDKQLKVVNNLRLIEKAIENEKHQLELLDEFIKTRFVEMFGDPVSDTKKWGQKPLKEMLESIRYGASSPPEFSNEGYAFIRATNIKKGKIVNNDMKYISQHEADRLSKCKLLGGEVIIVRSGVNAGDTCVVTSEYKGQYAGYDLILVLNKTLNPIFLNVLINTSYMEKVVKPMTRRAAQPHLNSEQTQSFPIICVPKELQDNFAEFVNQVDRLKEDVNERLKKYEELLEKKLYEYFIV